MIVKNEIEKYLEGVISDDERQLLVKDVREDKELDAWMRSQLEDVEGYMPDRTNERVWEAIQTEIAKDKQCRGCSSRPSVLRWCAVVGICLVLMGVAAWMGHSWYEPNALVQANLPIVVSTGAGEHSRIVLPDGTEVTLNAMTTLQYDCAMSSGERRVLVEGEAFFDVAKDSIHPFVIDVNQMEVTCLGTSLNVCNYEDDQTASVVLVDGKVRVVTDNGDLTMEPNSRVECDKQSLQLTKQVVIAANYTCWLRGETRYNDQSLEDITRDLARNYHMQFVIANDNLRAQCYTGFLGACSLRNVLDILTITTNMSYKIDGDLVYIFARN